jgi:hypothetical protein
LAFLESKLLLWSLRLLVSLFYLTSFLLPVFPPILTPLLLLACPDVPVSSYADVNPLVSLLLLASVLLLKFLLLLTFMMFVHALVEVLKISNKF